jgi:hypothetical protein
MVVQVLLFSEAEILLWPEKFPGLAGVAGESDDGP